MWTFIFLYTLGLHICQATGKDNSTQMYYVKLIIEKSAIKNVTELLRPFVNNNKLTVDNLKITTICESAKAVKVCTCETGYRWSDELYNSDLKCRGVNCTFNKNLNHTCISDSTVTIAGSLTLSDQKYQNCLSNNVVDYNTCNNELLHEIKNVYSTLTGFDNLAIGQYSVGSIIANFILTIAAEIRPIDLKKKSDILTSFLNASLVLETTGVVQLSKPPDLVRYDSQLNLICSSNEDLGTQPVWQLRRTDSVFDITDGTESTVKSVPKNTTLHLKNISEYWAGEYTCTYQQKFNSSTIIHKASVELNVALLPKIDISTVPAFPRCKTNLDFLSVTVKCEIRRSTEKYDVTWENPNSTSIIREINISSPSKEIEIRAAQTFVGCTAESETPTIKCIFKNRLNQDRHASIVVNTIDVTDRYCKADGDWGETKAGFTALLKCKNAAGKRQRKCNNGSTVGEWGSEYSACVNLDVNSVLEGANNANIGLGLLDQNAANLFYRLQNVTNNTARINTFANINASVQVLVSLEEKLPYIKNKSAVNDVLESSSNLLEKSLNTSWETKEENSSLAERYLNTVERLIQITNVTNFPRKTNLEVAKTDCTMEKTCTNTVFNANVTLTSTRPDSVKTAGFKQLEKYLPNKNENFTPNSIVVSTTTENHQTDGVTIQIDFPLINPRPRNVRIMCVSWNNQTREWSEYGCKWAGSSNAKRCTCTHLSSFAILMSKTPLTIKGITEITYVGLSVSVISLIISLVIELIVWSTVVKTNSLYLRHTAHINISLCLLVANCCFLASSTPEKIPDIWCKTSAVLKHFCYLSMFFWMLCLSITLLHKAVFIFHNVSKKNYLRFSLVLGYVCPLLIVTITFLTNKAGEEEVYFSRDTCWLVYTGFLEGSIHTFVIPVGIIVFVNVFSMVVVIMKLLDHNIEKSNEKEKTAAKTAMRSVILLTPIFGVTWLFGFAVMFLDLTYGNTAFVVNYAFTLLNSFQGLFILLTTCLGEKMTREALLNRLRKNAPASTTDSSTKLGSTLKK